MNGKRNVFIDVILKRVGRANRIPLVHSPLIPPLPNWREGGIGEPWDAFERTENPGWALGTDIAQEAPRARLSLLLAHSPCHTIGRAEGEGGSAAIGLPFAISTVN